MQVETPTLNLCLSRAARPGCGLSHLSGVGLCTSCPGFPTALNLPPGKRGLKELLRFYKLIDPILFWPGEKRYRVLSSGGITLSAENVRLSGSRPAREEPRQASCHRHAALSRYLPAQPDVSQNWHWGVWPLGLCKARGHNFPFFARVGVQRPEFPGVL